MAVAIATFKDSVSPPRGIVIALVTKAFTSSVKPLPSLPITISPSVPTVYAQLLDTQLSSSTFTVAFSSIGELDNKGSIILFTLYA